MKEFFEEYGMSIFYIVFGLMISAMIVLFIGEYQAKAKTTHLQSMWRTAS